MTTDIKEISLKRQPRKPIAVLWFISFNDLIVTSEYCHCGYCRGEMKKLTWSRKSPNLTPLVLCPMTIIINITRLHLQKGETLQDKKFAERVMALAKDSVI